jgi:hypothetical protein
MTTLQQLREISEKLSGYLSGLNVRNEGRHRISAALLHIADGHFQAIILLFEKKLYASAFALLRAQIETALRGAWVLHCNDEVVVDKAVLKDKFPELYEVIALLEQLEGFKHGRLSKLLAPCKKALHSYTHGGSYQIAGHLTPDSIEASFSDELVADGMSLAGLFGLFTAVNVALVADNATVTEAIVQEIEAAYG